MTTLDQPGAAGQSISLAQRRAYVALTLEDRRKLLSAQAERMIAHYEGANEESERLAWQGGDIVEP